MSILPYLLDTNLLLLCLVAKVDRELIPRFKRVDSFAMSDGDLLISFLGSSPIITTPHILAEVSNFVDHAPLSGRERLLAEFRRFAMEHSEVYEAAKLLATNPHFSSIGLADTGMLSLARTSHIVTVDYRLAGKIAAEGCEVTNFNHLRAVSYRSS